MRLDGYTVDYIEPAGGKTTSTVFRKGQQGRKKDDKKCGIFYSSCHEILQTLQGEIQKNTVQRDCL